MGLIWRLSVRNLLRQKKRSFFLGIGIAFGMAILVIANSFSHGMVDVLIQDIVANAFGHLVIDASPGNSFSSVIRDKEFVEEIIRKTIPPEDLIMVNENLGTMATAVGRGESDNVVVVGVTVETAEDQMEFFRDFLTLIEGDFEEYNSTDYAFPVVISEQKARSLNVGVHDTVSIRIPMITGQVQAARLTVIALANANNTFMDLVLFMDGQRLKQLMGYQPWESAGLQITLRDPKRTAAIYADAIHAQLEPGVLAIQGTVETTEAILVAYRHIDEAKALLRNLFGELSGDAEQAFSREGVLVSTALAEQLQLSPGDKFTFHYPTRFRGEHAEEFSIHAVFRDTALAEQRLVLVNEERIHPLYNRYLPASSAQITPRGTHLPGEILATQWHLRDRASDFQEMLKLVQEERRVRTTQTRFSVTTMYEGASQILRLEEALNLITALAVLVLFVIILIGVMNTLRMTVRERTREIGTVRAIGMHKRDVRNMFLLETLLLTAAACVVGILVGLVAMWGLGSIEFDANNMLSMILRNRRIHFKINPQALVTNFLLILAIAGITAYFPARHAARLSAVDALRHH